jgi:hypothetical protein
MGPILQYLRLFDVFDTATLAILGAAYDKAIANLHDRGQPSIVREVIAPCGERRARDRSPVRGRYRASVRVGILQRRAEQKRRRRKFGFPSRAKLKDFAYGADQQLLQRQHHGRTALGPLMRPSRSRRGLAIGC